MRRESEQEQTAAGILDLGADGWDALGMEPWGPNELLILEAA